MDMTEFEKIEDEKVNIVGPSEGRTDIYYFDADGKLCDAKDAVRFIGKIFDKNDNLINESWGEYNQEENKGRVK